MPRPDVPRAAARSLGVSTLCWRKLHPQCVATDCTCECHEALAASPPPLEVVPTPAPADRLTAERRADLKRGLKANAEPVLVWEEPPHPGRQPEPAVTPEQLAELDAHPGKWARVRTFPGENSATTMRKRAVDRRQPDPDLYELRASRLAPYGRGTGSALYARRRPK